MSFSIFRRRVKKSKKKRVKFVLIINVILPEIFEILASQHRKIINDTVDVFFIQSL